MYVPKGLSTPGLYSEARNDLAYDDNSHDSEGPIELPDIRLLGALTQDYPLPEDFQETLQRNPDLASERLPDSDLYPLHAACLRQFPDRFGDDDTCRVTDLVADVLQQRDLIASLVSAVSGSACKRLDEEADLPVHVLSRRLME